MFIVLNKQKIYSYLALFSTVIALFIIAFAVTNNEENVIVTSANAKELPIYNVQTNENKIALTMNCAWNADDIDKILEILEKNQVKITFFVVGEWANKYPEALKKMASEGHEIANHSDTHPHVNNLSSEANIKEIENCSQKIENIIGKKTTLYRAPYGEYNNTVIKSAKEAGHTAIQWNLDTLDYTGLTGEEMWARLNGKLQKGSIILMHNGTEHTADSLNMLLNNIKKEGFQVVTVSSLIYKDGCIIDNNGTQKLQ